MRTIISEAQFAFGPKDRHGSHASTDGLLRGNLSIKIPIKNRFDKTFIVIFRRVWEN